MEMPKNTTKYYIRLDKALELTESIVRDCYHDFLSKRPATLEQELEWAKYLTNDYAVRFANERKNGTNNI